MRGRSKEARRASDRETGSGPPRNGRPVHRSGPRPETGSSDIITADVHGATSDESSEAADDVLTFASAVLMVISAAMSVVVVIGLGFATIWRAIRGDD